MRYLALSECCDAQENTSQWGGRSGPRETVTGGVPAAAHCAEPARSTGSPHAPTDPRLGL